MQIDELELRAMIRSSVDEERKKAIIYIAQNSLIKFYDELTAIAGTDPNQDIRYLARKAFDHISKTLAQHEKAKTYETQSISELLFSKDPYARFEGLKKALKDGNLQIEELLKQALEKEGIPQLRASFVAAIGRFKRLEDIEFFRRFLKDDDARVRANAIESLQLIGSNDALKVILSQMSDTDNRVRANVLVALKDCPGPSLFELIKEMAADKSLWMRESSVYALSKIHAPKALALLARMSVYDKIDVVRKKAIAVLEREKQHGNPVAVQLLEKIAEFLSTDTAEQEFLQETEIEIVEKAEVSGALSMLQSPEAAKRYIAICKISSEFNSSLTDVFKSAFSSETDPFLLTMMISCVKENRIEALLKEVATTLGSSDDRVRANAVETLGDISPELYHSQIFPLLEDKHSRTMANAVLALHKIGKVDTFFYLKKMLMNGQEAFRLSALYIMSIIKESSHVALLEMLFDDQSPSVRDKTLEVLKVYVADKVSGSLKLFQDVKKRIHLHKKKDHFFENSLDELFGSFIDMIKMDDPLGSKQIPGNPQREKAALLKLAAKCLQLSCFNANFMMQLNNIENELKNLADVLQQHQDMAEGDEKSVDEEAEIMAELELLRSEMKKLKARREAMLCSSALDIWTEKASLDPEMLQQLNEELMLVENSMAQHFPETRFSMLPKHDAHVGEIFDVTMSLYQKHVWAFSYETCIRYFALMGSVIVIGVIVAILTLLSKVLAFLSILAIIPIIAYISFFLFVRWKIVIACMVDDYIHGREVSSDSLSRQLEKNYIRVAGKVLMKSLLLFLWFFMAVCCSSIFLGFSTYTIGNVVLTASLKLLGFITFALIFGRSFLKYQFIEPLAIFTDDCDPFVVSDQIYKTSTTQIIALFFFASFMATVVTATSTSIIGHLIQWFRHSYILIIPLGLLASISSVCMTPILYSNMVIFTLMKSQKDKL